MNSRSVSHSPFESSRSAFHISVAAAALFVLAGCTIFNPFSLTDTDRRFPREKPVGTPSAAGEVSACTTGATCEGKPDVLDAYYGNLAQVMWATDLERRALTTDALERSNLNSAFNALTWPVVSFAAAKKLRDPGWNIRDVVALGFAAYKVLGEGIPERDRIYLQTANRLACSMLAAEASLYAKAQQTDLFPTFELDRLSLTLKNRLDAHEESRSRLLADLKLDFTPLKKPADEIHSDRRKALGLSNGGGRRDPSVPMLAALDQTFSSSEKTLADANLTVRRIRDAGTVLRNQSSRIKATMFAELQGRAPDPRDPFAAAREVVDVFNKAIAQKADATAGDAKGQSRNAGAGAWEPTPERLKGLLPDGPKMVTSFWTNQEIPLRAARRETQSWLAQHHQRVKDFKSEASQLGCGTADISLFIAELAAKVVAPVAPSGNAKNAPGESAIPPGGATP